MKEFVFLVMFEMCIAKEQRSSMALPVLSRKATVPIMSGLPGHFCHLRRTVICNTTECSGPGVTDIDWSILNSVHMVMHESLSTIDEYVEYETSSKDLSMVVVFTDDWYGNAFLELRTRWPGVFR